MKTIMKTDNEDIYGILDPTGKNKNPFTGNEYSEQYVKLAKSWSTFPAYQNIHDTIQTIRKNQIILVISGTGSGKTVLIPKIVMHAISDKGVYNKHIAITLPKQVVAKASAVFAANTLDVKLGEEVGYQYQGSDKSSRSDKTKLLYATDGSIVAQLLKDPLLQKYDAVIIDEAHERKVQIDFLLYLLRDVVEKRPEFKLVIMSATINDDIFRKYFKKSSMALLNISGKSNYPIESIFLKNKISSSEYLKEGFSIIKKIIKDDVITEKNKDSSHDIIFFVTSKSETVDVCKDIHNVFCIEVFSGITQDNEELAIDKNKYKVISGKDRKIIVGTNVAESSLTVDGIRYVIDSGYELSNYYDPKLDAKCLEKKFISKAQAKQRMGRAGRTEPGICYHLYTKEQFDSFKDYPEPSIRRSDITSECLKLLIYANTIPKLGDILNSFIEPPNKEYISSAIDIFNHYNLIDKNDTINDKGIIFNKMNLGPFEGQMLLSGAKYQCSREIIAIIALLKEIKGNIANVFFDDDEKFQKGMNKYKNKYGDFVGLYHIMDDYRNKSSNMKYIRKSVVDKATRYQSKLKYDNDLRSIINNIEQADISGLSIEERITKAVSEGYSYHTATHHSKETYTTSKGYNVKLGKSLLTKPSEKIIYFELFVLKTDSRTDMSLNLIQNYI